MNTRRDALRLVAIASAAIPTLAANQEMKEKEDQAGHVHTGPAIKVPAPSKPTFFQPAEFATAEALTECIIPRSDTPGAKEAGVALLIDKAIIAKPALGPLCRAGLADLNSIASSGYGSPFVALTEAKQILLLTSLSIETDTPLGQFFDLFKSLTVDAYYKTEVGLKTELGWNGNTYLKTFAGCTHPEHQA